MPTQNSLKIIGKEFLTKPNDWYYVNFNPFVNNFTQEAATITSNAKIYLYSLDSFNEPTLINFKDVLTIEDLNTYRKVSGVGTSFSTSCNISLNYNTTTKTRYIAGIDSINIADLSEAFAGTLTNYFVVIEIPIVGVKGTYGDIPSSVSNNYVMIPSSLCGNVSPSLSLTPEQITNINSTKDFVIEFIPKVTGTEILVSNDENLKFDPYYEQVLLFLNNKSFFNKTYNNKTGVYITNTGVTIDDTNTHLDSPSYYFSDAADSVMTMTGTLPWNTFGTDDFTIEFSAKVSNINATTGAPLLDNRVNSGSTSHFFIGLNSSGQVYVKLNSTITITGTSNQVDKWVDIVLVRENTSFGLFINGVMEASYGVNAISYDSSAIYFGKDSVVTKANGGYLTGYMNNIRITRYARYQITTQIIDNYASSNVLILDGNDLVDKTGRSIVNSGVIIDNTISKFGGGSMKFNGSSYLTTPATTDFDFGASAGNNGFTIEFWFKLNSIGSIIYFMDGSNTLDSFPIKYSNGKLIWDGIDKAYTLEVNTWYHLAVSLQFQYLSYNQISMFINGERIAQGTSRTSWFPGTQYGGLRFGRAGGVGSSGLDGYIDDLRITKVARYNNLTTFIPTELLYQTITSNTIPALTEPFIYDYYSTLDKVDILNDGSGLALYRLNYDTKDSGGKYNASNTGVTFSTSVDPVSFRSGVQPVFEQYAQLTTTSVINFSALANYFGTNQNLPFSISCFIRRVDSSDGFFSFGDNTGINGIYISPGGNIVNKIISQNNGTTTLTKSLVEMDYFSNRVDELQYNNYFYNLIITYDGNKLETYIDNNLIASLECTLYCNGNLKISNLNGRLEQFRFFNRKLFQNEFRSVISETFYYDRNLDSTIFNLDYDNNLNDNKVITTVGSSGATIVSTGTIEPGYFGPNIITKKVGKRADPGSREIPNNYSIALRAPGGTNYKYDGKFINFSGVGRASIGLATGAFCWYLEVIIHSGTITLSVSPSDATTTGAISTPGGTAGTTYTTPTTLSTGFHRIHVDNCQQTAGQLKLYVDDVFIGYVGSNLAYSPSIHFGATSAGLVEINAAPENLKFEPKDNIINVVVNEIYPASSISTKYIPITLKEKFPSLRFRGSSYLALTTFVSEQFLKVWVYIDPTIPPTGSTLATSIPIISTTGNSSTSTFYIGLTTEGFVISDNGSTVYVKTGMILGEWFNISYKYPTLYINGIPVQTTGSSNTYSSWYIGNSVAGSNQFVGYISGLTISNASGLEVPYYSSRYSITDNRLVIKPKLYDKSKNYNITKVGTLEFGSNRINNKVPLRFRSTANYLQLNDDSSPDLYPGQDLTLEGIFYLNKLANFTIYQYSTSKLYITPTTLVYYNGSVNYTFNYNFNLNETFHLRCLFKDLILYVYINGILIDFTTVIPVNLQSVTTIDLFKCSSSVLDDVLVRNFKIVADAIETYSYNNYNFEPNAIINYNTKYISTTKMLDILQDGSCSGLVNNATPIGSCSMVNQIGTKYKFIKGKFGRAIRFPGNGALQGMTGTILSPYIGKNFSVSLWYSGRDAWGGLARILEYPGFWIKLNNTGNLVLPYGTIPGLDSLRWNHLVYVNDNDTHTIYLNGKIINEYGYGTTTTPNSFITIGGCIGTDYVPHSRFDQVRFFNRPLDPFEIEIIMNERISNNTSKIKDIFLDGSCKALYPLMNNANEIDYNGADFEFGLDDFTIESWINVKTIKNGQIFQTAGSNASGLCLLVTSASKIGCYFGGWVITSSASVTLNTWMHVALVKINGYLKLYINGSLDSSVANTTIPSGANPTIGTNSSATSEYYDGYLNNLRVSKGIARYTANFTPSTTDLPNDSFTSLYIKGDNASYCPSYITPPQLDQTDKPAANINGSMLFNNNLCSLLTKSNNDFAFGTGDFTFETWVKPLTLYASEAILISIGLMSTNAYFYVSLLNNNIRLGFGTGTWAWPTLVNSNITLSTSVWSHLVIQRKAGTIIFYINGVSTYTIANTTSIATGGNVYIGDYFGNGSGLNGYMSDLRVSKVARYNEDFTPPTTNVGYDTDTSLYLKGDTLTNNGVSGNLVYNTGVNCVPTENSITPKVGSKMLRFDGTVNSRIHVPTTGINGINTGVTIGNGVALFNGTSSRLEFNNLANTIDPDSDISCSIWVSDNAYSNILLSFGSLGNGFRIGGNLTLETTGVPVGTSSNLSILDTKFNHICLTYEKATGTFNMYLNGNLGLTQISNWKNFSLVRKIVLGCSPLAATTYEKYSSMYMKQFRVFNRALTSLEVLKLFNERTTFDVLPISKENQSLISKSSINTKDIFSDSSCILCAKNDYISTTNIDTYTVSSATFTTTQSSKNKYKFGWLFKPNSNNRFKFTITNLRSVSFYLNILRLGSGSIFRYQQNGKRVSIIVGETGYIWVQNFVNTTTYNRIPFGWVPNKNYHIVINFGDTNGGIYIDGQYYSSSSTGTDAQNQTYFADNVLEFRGVEQTALTTSFKITGLRGFNRRVSNREIDILQNEKIPYTNNNIVPNDVILAAPSQFKFKKLSSSYPNVYKSKLFNRYTEEITSKLIQVADRTLQYFGEDIQMYDLETNKYFTISKNNNPIAISHREKVFLSWLKVLSATTGLKKFNDYISFNNNLNSSNKFDIVIPEIIFDILADQNLRNLNTDLFTEYLAENPLSADIIAELTEVGLTTEDFVIDDIVYTFSKYKINYDNRTPIVFGADGVNWPDLSNIAFGNKPLAINYIFSIQRNSLKDYLITPPTIMNYFDKPGSCLYSQKPSYNDTSLNTLIGKVNALSNIDYYVSPDGSDTNTGKQPFLPKKTLTGIPSGKTVMMLPGTYSELVGDGVIYPKVFLGANGQTIYGCGNSTIIDTTSSRSYIHELHSKVVMVVPLNAENLKLVGMKIKYDGNYTDYTNYDNGIITIIKHTLDYTNGVYSGKFQTLTTMGGLETYVALSRSNTTFKNVTFECLGTYALTFEGITNKYYNCSFSGGTQLPVINESWFDPDDQNNYPAMNGMDIYQAYAYYINNGITSQSYSNGQVVIDTQSNTGIENSLINYDISVVGTLVGTLNSQIAYTPTYIAIPVSDDSDSETNSIQLETNVNTTNIPNLDYNLV